MISSGRPPAEKTPPISHVRNRFWSNFVRNRGHCSLVKYNSCCDQRRRAFPMTSNHSSSWVALDDENKHQKKEQRRDRKQLERDGCNRAERQTANEYTTKIDGCIHELIISFPFAHANPLNRRGKRFEIPLTRRYSGRRCAFPVAR